MILFKKYRYSYLIDQYLKENLLHRKLLPLKQHQQQNCFLNSCTGSGKTLSYLLPIMNTILQNNNRLKYHGAIILTLNKELCAQIYRQVRLLDPEGRIKVRRTGPITHFSPVIDEMNKLSKGKQQQINRSQMDIKINKNISNNVNWKQTDILISTSVQLTNIFNYYVHKQQIQPSYLIIDQADLLLEIDQNVTKNTNKIIKKFINCNSNLKIFISCSSFPNKINNIEFNQLLLKNKFNFISGINKHKLPNQLNLFYIEILNQLQYQILQSKLQYLQKIFTEQIISKCIIFVNNGQYISAIIDKMISLGKKPVPYCAQLDSNQRTNILNEFIHYDTNVLVSTDLASRGLDFPFPIHTVIEFDMANNITNFINRAGRTARNGLPGTVITFVTPNDKQMFEHLISVQSNNMMFDELFSRKRSYRKMYKKQ